MEKVLGFLAPLMVSGIIFILNGLLPGRWVTGYITKPGSGEKMRYHLNGISVYFALVIIWFLSGYLKIIPYDWLYNYRWYGLAGACISGLVFSLTIVFRYPRVRRSVPADLFLGRVENLQVWGGRVDLKMWLYLTGATMLQLNVLSFTARHVLKYGDQFSPGIFVSAALITFFIIDYLIFEEVHLYTYDLFAERIGFKLGWGCLVFYPYFYPVFLWATVELPDTPMPDGFLIVFILLFLAGWVLSRGANLQKYYFKKTHRKKFFGIDQETITDGNKTLLVNGFWGLSRHINYLGEILMATGIILCAGYPMLIWPWLYPLYYVFLLSLRQIDDNRRCTAKYGALWKDYEKKVPYRIIPFIY